MSKARCCLQFFIFVKTCTICKGMLKGFFIFQIMVPLALQYMVYTYVLLSLYVILSNMSLIVIYAFFQWFNDAEWSWVLKCEIFWAQGVMKNCGYLQGLEAWNWRAFAQAHMPLKKWVGSIFRWKLCFFIVVWCKNKLQDD